MIGGLRWKICTSLEFELAVASRKRKKHKADVIMPCLLTAETCLLETPLGDMQLTVCSNGVHSLHEVQENDETFHPDLKKSVVLMTEKKSGNVSTSFQEVHLWLKTYFKKPNQTKSLNLPRLCLDSSGKKAHWKIWMALGQNIHPGQTISYSDLAILTGYSKGAAQLVGQAMATNPFQIIIPCHRVITKSGIIGQYSRGKKNKVKEWLLKFEDCEVDNSKKRKECA